MSVAAGETVGRGGYAPSVFAELANYVEMAGNARTGSFTIFASVLSDGDERDPLSQAARSLLDGHIERSSAMARAGKFPAIDILASSSRIMKDVVGNAMQGMRIVYERRLPRWPRLKMHDRWGWEQPEVDRQNATEAAIEGVPAVPVIESRSAAWPRRWPVLRLSAEM